MKSILTTFVILFAATLVLAQETSIDKATFDGVMKNSFGALMGKAYRTTDETK